MKIKRLLNAPEYRERYVCETEDGFFGFCAVPFREIEEKDLTPMPGYICTGKMAEEAPEYLLRFYGLEKEVAPEKRTEYLHVRILPSVKTMAEETAAAEGRTLSNYIENLIKKECEGKKKAKIYTADRETGTFIDEFSCVAKAKAAIEDYEKKDRQDGTYTEDFYDIVDENHCPVEW